MNETKEEGPPVAGSTPTSGPLDPGLEPSPGPPPLLPRPASPRPFPGPLGFVILVGLAMVLQFLLLGVVIAVTGARSLRDLTSETIGLLALLQSLGWPLVAIVALRTRNLTFGEGLNWRWHGRYDRAFMGLGAVAGVLMVLPAMWLKLMVTRLTGRDTNILDHLLGFEFSAMAVVLITVAVLVVAPVGEEMLFRGLALRGLKKRYGFWPAALMVSALFAAVHLQASAVLPIFLLSMMLCWFVHRTESLLPCIVCHLAYNGIQVAGWLVVWWRGLPGSKAAEAESVELPAVLISCMLLLMCLVGVDALVRKREEKTGGVY